MRRRGPKRTYRIRRADSGDIPAGGLAEDVAAEVIFRTGCCLVEAVVSASVLAALIVVPAHLLLG